VSLLQSLNATKSSSNLSNHYSWPQFPPGLEQSFCLHWIPCTGSNNENWISDSVSAFIVVYCSFVIHKLMKKISLIKLHILYDSLAHRLH
jgi:hypothetical protein